MPQNTTLSKLDPSQALMRAFEVEHDAVRMVFGRDHAMEMAISADEGDSVQAVARTVALPLNEEVACSQLKSLTLYGPGKATLMVSPVSEGDVFFNMGEHSAGEIVSVMALRLKLVSSDTIYAVGQS